MRPDEAPEKSALKDNAKSLHRVLQNVENIDEELWRRRVHKRLFDAGLLATPNPEKSPISILFLLQDGTGYQEVRLTLLVKSGVKRRVDAAFKPYKSHRIHGELFFHIPVEFFEEGETQVQSEQLNPSLEG